MRRFFERFVWAIVCAPLLLAACATPMATNTSFGPASAKAMMIMAGPQTSYATTIEFRRVDFAKNDFGPEYLNIGSGAIGGTQINPDTKSPTWLIPQMVAPGDYAIIGTYVQTFNGVSSGMRWKCFLEAAPVYSLQPGKIGIVRAEIFSLDPNAAAAAAVSDAAVLQEFAEARKNYPGIDGEAVVLKPSAVISYSRIDGFWFPNSKCEAKPGIRKLK